MKIIWNFKEHRWSYFALFIFVIIGARSVFFNLLAYNLALRDFTSTKIPEVLEAIGAFIGGFRHRYSFLFL
jgi:ABC-type microcin C transport system permease subunit YejE